MDGGVPWVADQGEAVGILRRAVVALHEVAISEHAVGVGGGVAEVEGFGEVFGGVGKCLLLDLDVSEIAAGSEEIGGFF